MPNNQYSEIKRICQTTETDFSVCFLTVCVVLLIVLFCNLCNSWFGRNRSKYRNCQTIKLQETTRFSAACFCLAITKTNLTLSHQTSNCQKNSSSLLRIYDFVVLVESVKPNKFLHICFWLFMLLNDFSVDLITMWQLSKFKPVEQFRTFILFNSRKSLNLP